MFTVKKPAINDINDFLLRQVRDKVGRYLRDICKRFIVPLGQARQELEDVARLDNELRMLGSKALGDLLCIPGLVLIGFLKANGEGVDWPALYDQYSSQVQAGTSNPDLITIFQQMLDSLGDA